MGIDFGMERWIKVKNTYRLWWEGKLDRPIIPVVLDGRKPGREKPPFSLLSQATCADLSISPKDLVDRIDYEFSTKVFLGDAYPLLNLMEFGPGLVAAFLGANLDNSSGRVWFSPQRVLPISELHFEYNPDNIWLNRIKDICIEAINRWQGQVLVGMPDLGGVLDVLATFRTTENLLLEFYDYPDEVKRLTWELHHLWHRYFNEIHDLLQPINPGYSDWSTVFCEKPFYTPQCDISYMLSPEMFAEFCKPELEASFKKLEYNMYHLDGTGQIAHLDSLLPIQELRAVQWIPGDGKPNQSCWPEIYQKIQRAGKKIQLNDGFAVLDTVIEQIGTGKGIQHYPITGSITAESDLRKRLSKYGIEE